MEVAYHRHQNNLLLDRWCSQTIGPKYFRPMVQSNHRSKIFQTVNIATTTKKTLQKMKRNFQYGRNVKLMKIFEVDICQKIWKVVKWNGSDRPEFEHISVLPMTCIGYHFAFFFPKQSSQKKQSHFYKIAWRLWFEMKSNTSQLFDEWFQKTFFWVLRNHFFKVSFKKA